MKPTSNDQKTVHVAGRRLRFGKFVLPGVLALGLLGLGAAAMAADALPFGGTRLQQLAGLLKENFLEFREQVPLSQEQKQDIARVMTKHRSEIQSIMGRSRMAREAVFSAAKVDPQSPATLAAADQVGAVARDRALLAAKLVKEISPILTPAQTEFLQKARAEMENALDQPVPGI